MPHNTQRTPSPAGGTGAHRTGGERHCGNCGRPSDWIARQRCARCYYYRKRHGEERPERMRPRRRGRSYKGPQMVEVDTGHGSGPCWVWQWSRFNTGYGRLALSNGYVTIHRLTYRMLVGPIPPDHELHHTCENKPCCNPDHLLPVTREEHLKLTARVKLDRTKAAEVRRMAAAGVPVPEIMRRFGISDRQARRVINGEQWADAGAEPESAA